MKAKVLKAVKIPKEILVLGMIFLALAGLSATAHAEDSLSAGKACAYGSAAGVVVAGVEGFAEKKAPSGARVVGWAAGSCALGIGMSAADSYAGDAPSENELKQEPANNQE